MSKNPGKNHRGQQCRARVHHTGPEGEGYLDDAIKRRETKCKRLKTLKKSLHVLSKKTGLQLRLQWRDGDEGSIQSYATEGCSISCVSDNGIRTPEVVDPDLQSGLAYPDPPAVEDVSDNEEDKCKICHKVHIGKKKNCIWLKCDDKKCDFWAHALCLGLFGKQEEISDIKYMCPQHIKKYM